MPAFQEVIDRLRWDWKYYRFISFSALHNSDQCENWWELCLEIVGCKTKICWRNRHNMDWWVDETLRNELLSFKQLIWIVDIQIGAQQSNKTNLQWKLHSHSSQMISLKTTRGGSFPAKTLLYQPCFKFECQQKKHCQYVEVQEGHRFSDGISPLHQSLACSTNCWKGPQQENLTSFVLRGPWKIST